MIVNEVGVQRPDSGLSFTDLLLIGVILLMLTLGGIGMVLYVAPPTHLRTAEAQPAVRVARESEFPVGTSRVVSWADRIILVVRGSGGLYFALQGVSPIDGCILEWDEESSRIVSPCSYLVYDFHGNVVAGLTTAPLRRYAVFVRDGVVYVGGD